MKKALSLVIIFTILSALLFLPGIPISAADAPSPKEEVVYGLLNLDGSVSKLYVVNIFNGGEITDYGNYTNIRNMTTSEKITQKGDQITVNTGADKFYYQGTLEKKELPWDITIKYFLDGEELSGEELAGKSGRLKITISVKQNNRIDDNSINIDSNFNQIESSPNKINSNFFDNYALQIAISLDNKLCSNIETDNATIAEAGGKKQLTYTVLPGKGIDIAVTADVRDFEMDAITINGIRLSLGIAIDNDAFTGQVSQLIIAIRELDDGAAELLEGLEQLSNGMQKYIDGLKAYKDGLGQLADGVDKLDFGASELSRGLSELTKQNDSLVNAALAIQQAAFDSANAQLAGINPGLPVLTPENYSTVLSSMPGLAEVKRQLDNAVQFTQGLKAYTDGVAKLGKGASDLAGGISEFKSSSSAIISSANELYKAGEELNNAVKALRSGLTTYKSGTKELRNGTSAMSSEINNKIDEILGTISGSNNNVISFVSEKNTNVLSVQFVMKTDSIKIPKAPKVEASKPVELNFWQKLLKLFGLYRD